MLGGHPLPKQCLPHKNIAPGTGVGWNNARAMEAMMPDFFPSFEQRQIETTGATIKLVTGGGGPALLLLHGYPQTHVMWRKVAPRLAQDFTVVVPDLRCFRHPETIRATCDEYRAGASIDLVHDRADLSHKVRVAMLVLWGTDSGQGSGYDVLRVWRDHAGDVRGHGIDSGHFIPEEQPDQVYAALKDFFSA
jgi:haloacetate dehalogenase